MKRTLGTLTIIVVLALGTSPLHAAHSDSMVERATQHLLAETGGAAEVLIDPATSAPRLVRLPAQSAAVGHGSARDRVARFLREHGRLFGITDPDRELAFATAHGDRLGGMHLTYRQVWRGVPVFGGVLRFHFDEDGRLTTVNGTTVPDLQDLGVQPRIPAAEAAAAAEALAAKDPLGPLSMPREAVSTRLVVYRTGLLRGVPGVNRLAWEVALGNADLTLERVYVDASRGTPLNRISEIPDLSRTVHYQRRPNPVWTEGDSLPFTGQGTMSQNDIDEVNGLVTHSGEIHNLFANLSGGTFLSYTGADATMHSIQDVQSESVECPNAAWTGSDTIFCAGMASDDVIAHEWTHAYTQGTHGLAYQWQSGALNEAYSDIFGEIVDLLNGAGTDSPDLPRLDGECSTVANRQSPRLEVLEPAAVSGGYAVGTAQFNPEPPWSVTTDVVLVDDGAGVTTDACDAITGFPTGSIALIDRGDCNFRVKAENVQDAGAAAAIVVNNEGDDLLTMGGAPALQIPSLFLGQSDGDALKDALSQGVRATIELGAATDPSLRWIQAEDTVMAGIRDMWNPVCFAHPGKVSDAEYHCVDSDNGGVHVNNGIANHAFTLITDGGTYNGETVLGIGLTKAAHIYWRAMSVYQVPITQFRDHADLIELSCSDLIDATLTDLLTGEPSPEMVTAADCAQVAAAMRAVEMRARPVQCNFQPLLDPDAPPVPGRRIFAESFDAEPGQSWNLSNEGPSSTYEPRDWVWTDDLPDGVTGGAMYAIDGVHIGDCGADDQSGVMHLDTPPITVPEDAAGVIVTFNHYVATEPKYDGGNVRVRVNGGTFQLVPEEMFVHNPYSDMLLVPYTNTNPMAGQRAFTGTDDGSFDGSWGQSQIDLSDLVQPGDRFRLRFNFGVDACNGNDGWYVDDLRVFAKKPGPRRVGGHVGPA